VEQYFSLYGDGFYHYDTRIGGGIMKQVDEIEVTGMEIMEGTTMGMMIMGMEDMTTTDIRVMMTMMSIEGTTMGMMIMGMTAMDMGTGIIKYKFSVIG
jgi:hypothetical protein